LKNETCNPPSPRRKITQIFFGKIRGETKNTCYEPPTS
jgi:hypothetical protein